MSKKKEKESYFYGKHFETLGDIWRGLYGNTEEFIEKYLHRSCAEGFPFFSTKFNGKTLHTLAYPKPQNVVVLNYVKEIRRKNNEHITICPVLKGAENMMKLKETYTWENGVEGEMAVESLTYNELIINFYNPFYPFDYKYFQPEENYKISLAAIALNAEELEERDDVYTEGAPYELYLKRFLEENPDKTEADFEPPVIQMRAEHFRMCVATETTSVYEIIGLIEDIEYTEFLGKKVAILKVNLEHREDDEYLYVNVYVSEHLLDNYMPEVNQGFHGIVVMNGYFLPENRPNPNVFTRKLGFDFPSILFILIMALLYACGFTFLSGWW